MVNKYAWFAIAGGLFAAGIAIGYAVFANTYTPSNMFNQQMMMNPQMAGQWTQGMMDNSDTRQQMQSQIQQDSQFMYEMMDDPEFQELMLERMQQNQQFGSGMMGGMTADPELRQQMFDTMMQNPQAMQQWMGDAQFQQEWYPYMMQNWMMGPGMGSGMMGGPMLNYGTDTSSVPSVSTSQVDIPQGAWSPRSATPYDPLRIEVAPGTTVTWTNSDSAVHTVTDVDNGFDSELINPGESWSYTFESEGEYNYYCTIHPWMKGAVEVESA